MAAVGRVGLIASWCLLTGACSGMTQMQDTLGKFDVSVHSVSATETSFLHNVLLEDCSVQFYVHADAWAEHPNGDPNLAGGCTPSLITPQQIAARQALLDALTLYADKLQALVSADTDKSLSSDAQTLATKLNGLAASHGLSSADKSIAASVEAGIIAITEMALDQRRFSQAKSAAEAMQPDLEKVVGALKAENSDFVEGVKGQQGQLEIVLHRMVTRASADERFEALLRARQIYQSADPFGVESLAQPGGAPAPDATKLNQALDAVVSANAAIARTGTGGIVAAVNDLVARVQAAQATQAALAK